MGDKRLSSGSARRRVVEVDVVYWNMLNLDQDDDVA
jgi:hypothetical protein